MAIDLDVHGNTKPLEAAVQAAINRIRRQPIKITVDDKGATQPLGNMKRAADEFSKSMEAANARILAFGASMAIINGVADAFKGMVRNLVEVEKSMADINVVMGLSTQNLDKFGDGLFKVAKETGAAFRVAADAATEYARQGLSMEESLKRTRDALILTRLTGMDSAEAVKSLTAAMNTYGNQIKDTTQLVSKFAAVDVQFAVSAEDFAAAISRTGQAAKTAGVDIDELIGIVTSAQQQTARGGAVIGNALKTIFTKTGRTDTLNQLEDLGIAVRDLEGNTIGAKRILTDLANTFDTLSEAQKAQITQTMGGLFHINILKAVLSDAAKQNGILARATEISSSATDEAVQKNQQLRETMSAMATETGLAIKQVSTQIGELMLAPGMEKILNTVKSLAEGASEILGNGESAGNKFATGFLKGIGNIITGPGLVVLTTVFVKLFMTAAKFTKESLSSLIGVTSEAQKQKAIQTSLVALIGQNAALGKEMLRTDITRTEKEKILLGLLKMQTAEAERLNAVSQKLASTLYARGYGPGLTQGKRRAYGHIPNFADPERSQAARGGYAAGSIRTMNMPGEGSIIYNSAETVKNFAGFKQPAIMPPQSSKAGKNYQQAFGSIHGFDPYAAGGYIPNYALAPLNSLKSSTGFRKFSSEQGMSLDDSYDMLKQYQDKHSLQNLTTKQLLTQYQGSKKKSIAAMLVPPEGYSGRTYATHSDTTWPVYALRSDAQTDPSLTSMVESDFKKTGSKYASKLSQILHKKNVTPGKFWETMQADTAGGAKGAWKAAVGALFEAAVNSALGYRATDHAPEEADFDVRGGNISLIRRAFDGFPEGMSLADYKSDDRSPKNRKSFRDKVVKQKKFIAQQKNTKLRAAYGFIPNFADPLSDAIGREKAAGVPVSQIRVGSHSALMSKGNPLGLGVTNTHDEPNGLRDVFGANGFVPNYAAQDFNQEDFTGSSATQRKKLAKILRERIKVGNLVIKSEKELAQIISQINPDIKLHGRGIRKANQLIETSNNTIASNNATRKSLGSRLMGGVKGMGQGMGGMGLMMGLPMLAGFIPGSDRPGSVGGVASGMMSGAATGASLGMMFPGFGTAIGAAIGALGGLVSSLRVSQEAIKEESVQRAKAFASFFPIADIAKKLAGPSGIGTMETGKFLGKTIKKDNSNIINVATGQITSPNPMMQKTVRDTLAQALPAIPDLSDFPSLVSTLPSGEKVLDEETFKASEGMGTTIRDEKGNVIGSSDRIKFDKAQSQLQAYNKNIKNIAGPQREIIFNLLDSMSSTVDMFPDLIKGEDGSLSFSKESRSMQTYGQFAQKIAGMLEGEQGLKNLDAVTKLLVEKMDEAVVNQSKQNDAIILRLNQEKTLFSAQDKFNRYMNESAGLAAEEANQYNFRLKTQGHLMTERQKAEMSYNKAISDAETQYYDSLARSQTDASKKIITTLQSGDYQDAFTRYLDQEKITEAGFGEKTLDEQREVLQIIGKKLGQEKSVTEIIENQKDELAALERDYDSIQQRAKDRAKTEQEITNDLIRQKTGPGAMGRGMDAAFFSMREQVKTMDYELGEKIPYAFADGLANAMSEGLSGAKSIGDALRDSAISFLQMIQQAMLQKAAYSMVGAMGFSGGGNVRNYSRGGG
ncbi:MAG: phage tail tape measure protein, partial [Crocinitomicaceae bacterium]|nr:phage tail tape measure protein [Crocinitomicaceae bacterium]